MTRALAWLLRPGVIWLLALTFAIFYSAIKSWAATRREVQTEMAIRRVDRVLTIWANHWGEPPEIVKPLLLNALKTPK